MYRKYIQSDYCPCVNCPPKMSKGEQNVLHQQHSADVHVQQEDIAGVHERFKIQDSLTDKHKQQHENGTFVDIRRPLPPIEPNKRESWENQAAEGISDDANKSRHQSINNDKDNFEIEYITSSLSQLRIADNNDENGTGTDVIEVGQQDISISNDNKNNHIAVSIKDAVTKATVSQNGDKIEDLAIVRQNEVNKGLNHKNDQNDKLNPKVTEKRSIDIGELPNENLLRDESKQLQKLTEPKISKYAVTQQIEDEQQSCGELNEKVRKLVTLIDKLQQEVKHEKTLHVELQQKVSETESLTHSLKRKVAENEDLNSELKLKLGDAKARCDKLEEKLAVTETLNDELKRELEGKEKLKESMRQLNENIKQLHLGKQEIEKFMNNVNEDNNRLKSHIQDLSARLAQEMSTKVAADEGSLENVNIKHRPMNISDEYRNLCSNQWHDAKTELDGCIDMEEERIKLLCDILKESVEQSTTIYKSNMDKLEQILFNPINYSSAVPYTSTETDLPRNIKVMVGDFMRMNSDKVSLISRVEVLKANLTKDIQSTTRASSLDNPSIEKYIKDCLCLTWKMVLQRPPMTFKMEGINEAWQGDKRQEVFWNSSDPKYPDSKVKYYVHPALYHGDNLMVRGKVFLQKTDVIKL